VSDLSASAPTTLPWYGAAVVSVHTRSLAAFAPYTAYALFGAQSAAAGGELNVVLGWNGAAWVNVTTARDAGTAVNGGVPPARRGASAAFLYNCRGTGEACIVVGGGLTTATGSALPGGSMSTWALLLGTSAASSPTWKYVPVTNGPGARVGVAMIASPDGTAVYVHGGDSLGTGSKTAGSVSATIFSMTTVGFSGATAVADSTATTAATNELTLVSAGKQCDQAGIWCAGAQATCSWCSYALDGDLNTNFNANGWRGAHAGTAAPAYNDPWWYVNLGSVTTAITRLQLWFRTDCCLPRVAPFEIWYGNNPPPCVPTTPYGTTPRNGYGTGGTGGAPSCAGTWDPATDATNTKLFNPYTDATTIPLTFDLPADISAQYIYVKQPGTARILTVIEFQVWVRKPWMWRTLGGAGYLSLASATATQSSLTSVPSSTYGQPSLAIDGSTTTMSGTRETLVSSAVGTNGIYFSLDLGTTMSLTRIEITAGSAAGVSAAINTARGQNVGVTSGLSRIPSMCNWRMDPTNIAAFSSQQVTINANTRFIHLYKTVSTSLSTTTQQYENTLQLQEIKVYGNRLANVPTARAGHAFAAYGSYMVMFGGYSSSLSQLSDLVLFDMSQNQWVLPITPLGTAPAGRSYAVFAPFPTSSADKSKNATLILLFAGQSAVGPIADTYRLGMPLCPSLTISANNPLSANAQTVSCFNGGGYCIYSCNTGYSPTNPTGTISCGYDGQWSGYTPLCSPSLSALVPTAPAVNAPTQFGTNGATVTWTAASVGSSGSPITGYLVETVPLAWTETFIGSFKTSSDWTFLNGPTSAPTSSYTFTAASSAQLILEDMAGAQCTATLQNCIILYRLPPTLESGSLSAGGSWALESFVSWDILSIKKPTAGNVAGIGIYDIGKTAVAGMTGALEFQAGLGFDAARGTLVGYRCFNAACSPGGTWIATPPRLAPGAAANNLVRTFDNTPYAHIRVERDSDAATFRIGYRFSTLEAWSFFPPVPDVSFLRYSATAAGPNGYSNIAANIRFAFTAHSPNTAIVNGIAPSSYFLAKYLRWTSLRDTRPGFDVSVSGSTTAATVSGLEFSTLSYVSVYQFRVTAITAIGNGAPGLSSTYTTPLAPAAPFPALFAGYVNAAAGKLFYTGDGATNTALRIPTAAQYPKIPSYACTASSDGAGSTVVSGTGSSSFNLARVNDGRLGTCGTGTCCFSATPGVAVDGDFLEVDLSFPTAVRELSIYNTHEPTLADKIDNFAVFVGNVASRGYEPFNRWKLNARCAPAQVPTAIGASSFLPATIGLPATAYAARFTCSSPTGLTGRYLYIQVPPGQQIFVDEVVVWSNSSCPARTATNAVIVSGSVCAAGSPLGSTCSHTCLPGYVQVSGATSSRCNGEAWNDAPLNCQLVCNSLSPTTFGSSCTMGLYVNDFSLPTSNSTLALVSAAAVPMTSIGGFAVVSGGVLQLNAGKSSQGAEVVIVAYTSAVRAWSGSFSWSANVYLTDDAAGLAWQIQDGQNMFRLSLNAATGVHELQRVFQGSITVMTTFSHAIAYKTWYPVSINSTQYTHNIYVGGRLLATVVDWSWTGGWPGVYAASSAKFDNLAYNVDCTAAGACSGLTDGSKCTFGCPSGMIAAGPSVFTCSSAMQSSGSTTPYTPAGLLTCTLPPPVFPTASISVAENSQKFAAVGAPLQASILTPGYSLIFIVKRVFKWGNTSIDRSVEAYPFFVDACSGAVAVATAACAPANTPYCAVLDYEYANFYRLEVSAQIQNAPAGTLVSETVTNISVSIINMDEPPQCTPQALNLTENTPAGTLIGTLAAYDQDTDPSNFRYALSIDSTGGSFSIDPLTGRVNLTRGGYDYEYVDSAGNFFRSFSLVARVYQTPASPYDPDGSVYGSCVITINLQDTNDPPVVPVGLSKSVDELTVNTAGLPISLGGVVDFPYRLDQDFLPFPQSSAVFSATPLAYALLNSNDAYAQRMCGNNPPTYTSWPTLDGSSTGTPLFSIDSTGTLSLVNRASSWADDSKFPVFNYNGAALRKAYALCMNVSDGTYVSTGLLTVNVIAFVVGVPIITNIYNATDMPALGGSTLLIEGYNFGNASVGWMANASLGCPTPDPLRTGGALGSGWCTGPPAPAQCATATSTSAACTTATALAMPCSVVVNDTLLACTTPAGQGTNLRLSLSVRQPGASAKSVTANFPFNPTISFAKPVVFSVLNGTDMNPTAAVGSYVTFVGANFGIQYRTCYYNALGSAAGRVELCQPIVYFTNTVDGVAVAPVTCSATDSYTLRSATYNRRATDPFALTTLDSVIKCKIPTWTGANIVWNITVGGQSVVASDSSQYLSYRKPVISSVTWTSIGVNPNGLLTVGGERFTIRGLYFGAAALPIAVYLGTWRMTVLSHTTTQILCTTAGGIGVNLGFTVSAAGNPSLSSFGSYSYKPIVLQSVSGPGSTGASTAGGDLVYLSGSGFGPIGLVPTAVQYGNKGLAGYLYTAQNCKVDIADIRVACFTAPGVGFGHAWLVSGGYGSYSNGGQLFAAGTSYAPPVVFGFSPDAVANAGVKSQVVTVSGRNFGPPDVYTNSLLSVSIYSSLTRSLAADPNTTAVQFDLVSGTCFITPPATTLIGNVSVVSANATNSSSSSAQSEVQCALPDGAGRDFTWNIFVDGQQSTGPSTSYAPPAILAVLDSGGSEVLNSLGTGANTLGGTVLYVTGQFFGPLNYSGTGLPLVQNVSMSNSPSNTVLLPSTSWTLVSQTLMMVTLPPNFGLNYVLLISVADQFTTTSSRFDYGSPIVLGVQTPLGNNLLNTFTPGGQSITLRVKNLPLLTLGSVQAWLHIGDGTFPNGFFQLTDLPTQAAAIAAVTNGDGSVNVTFRAMQDSILSGAGRGRALRVFLCSPVSAGNCDDGATSSTPLLGSIVDYVDPTVSNVVVSSIPITSPSSAQISLCPSCTYFVNCSMATIALTALGGSCPSSPVWYQVSIFGSNFGQELMRSDDGSVNSLIAPTSLTDLTTKSLNTDFLSTGSWTTADVSSASPSYVYEWTHSRVTLFVQSMNSSVQLQLKSTDWTLATRLQTVTVTYSLPTPVVIGISTASLSSVIPTSSTPPISNLQTALPGQSVDIYLKNFAWALSSAYVISVALGRSSSLVYFAGSTTVIPSTSALIDTDGSVVSKLTLVLPPFGAGLGVGVSVGVSSLSGDFVVTGSNADPTTWVRSDVTTLSSSSPSASPVSQLNYAGPSISQAGALPVSWSGSSDPTCPWPGSLTLPWTCDNAVGRLWRIDVYGSNFGPPTSAYLPSPLVSQQLLMANVSVDGGWDATSVTVPNMTSMWSDSRIVAYTTVQSGGTIMVSIGSTSFDNKQNYQNATFAIDADLPAIAGCASATVVNPTAYLSSSGLSSGSAYKYDLTLLNIKSGDVLFVGVVLSTGSSNSSVKNIYVPGAIAWPPAYPGPAAAPSLVNTDAAYTTVMQQMINGLVSGTTMSVSFYAPPGQGLASLFVTRRRVGVDKTSPSLCSLGYRNPRLTQAVVTVGGAARPTVDLSNPLSALRIVVPSDTIGTGTRLTIRGSNLGVSPAFRLGNGWLCEVATGYCVLSTAGASESTGAFFTDCSGVSPSDFSCWSFTPPRGESYGPCATGGYVLQVQAGTVSTTTDPTPFGYDLPSVTSIATVASSGTIPTTGGTLVYVNGANFGGQLLTTTSIITVLARDPNIPSSSFSALCSNVNRISNTLLECTTVEGAGSNLTVSVNVNAEGVGFTGCDTNSGITLSAFSYDSPFFSVSTLPTIKFGSSALYPASRTSEIYTVSDAQGFKSTYPLYMDKTVGGAQMTITGGNFGPAAVSPDPAKPPYCVFLSWANRPSTSPQPMCDGVESWLGEGELPLSSILSWSHTSISFVIPEGAGLKQVLVSARGSVMTYDPTVPGFSRNAPLQLDGMTTDYRMLFAFAPPIITSVTPLIVDTDGSTTVTVTGENFGPALYDSKTSPIFSTIFSKPLAVASTLPSSYTVFVLHTSCSTLNLDVRAQAITAQALFVPPNFPGNPLGIDLASCFSTMVSRSHTQVVVSAPAGIGLNRSVEVAVVDPPTDVKNKRFAAFSNETIRISYLPPQFLQDTNSYKARAFSSAIGNPIYLPGLGDSTVDVSGYHFGDPSLAVAQGWTLDDTAIYMKVNGALCANSTNYAGPPGPTRRIDPSGVNVITCALSGATTAGFADVEVTIAGNYGRYGEQDGFPVANATAILTPAQLQIWNRAYVTPFTLPLLIACSAGSYGKFGEACLTCPVGPGWSASGATCAGTVFPTQGLSSLSQSLTAPVAGSLLQGAGCNVDLTSLGTDVAGVCFSSALATTAHGCAMTCLYDDSCSGYTFLNTTTAVRYCYIVQANTVIIARNPPQSFDDLSFQLSPTGPGGLVAVSGWRTPFATLGGPYPVQTIDQFAISPQYWPILNAFYNYPVPLPGFFNLNDTVDTLASYGISAKAGLKMLSACPDTMRVGTRNLCIVPCDPTYACLGNNFCDIGYVSKAPMYRCASCDKGYFKSGATCVQCPDNPYGVLVVILFVLICVAALGFWLNKHQVNIAMLAIGVDFFQVVGILTSAPIKWDPAIKQLLQILSAFNLNIDIVAPECLVPDVSYATKWFVIVFLPILIGGLFLVQFVVLYLNKRLIKGHTARAKLCSHSPALVSSVFILMYIMYLYLVKSIMDVFNWCASSRLARLGREERAQLSTLRRHAAPLTIPDPLFAPSFPYSTPTNPPDGNTYLAAVFEKCTTPWSGTQETLGGWAILAIFVYMLGYPGVLGSTLWKYRELVMEDQLLRAKGVGQDKLSNPNALDMRRMFGRSYFQFKPQYFLWILAILLRKFCIAMTSVVFNKNPSFQMAACLLIMFLAYSAHVQIRPYMSPTDREDVIKYAALASTTDAMFARLHVKIAKIESQGRKKTTRAILSSSGRVDTAAAFSAIGAWLIDYNTVEAIMLFSAVIVCLFCLLFTVR
jgi:hypothetical protein